MSERTKGMIKQIGADPSLLVVAGDYRNRKIAGCPGMNGDQNAAHLAACWNACEGYDGELTPGLLVAVVKQMNEITEQAQQYAEENARLRNLCDKKQEYIDTHNL